MKNNLFRKVLYIASVICVVLVVIAMLLLPKVVDWYFINILNDIGNLSKGEVITFLYISAVPFLFIGISVVKLSKRLITGKVFYKSSMKELKVINICALVDFSIFFVGGFFIYKNLLCLAVMMGALMVFIISSVVRELIGNGIELQQDVDLTI